MWSRNDARIDDADGGCTPESPLKDALRSRRPRDLSARIANDETPKKRENEERKASHRRWEGGSVVALCLLHPDFEPFVMLY